MVLSDDRGEVVMGLCLPDRLTVVTVSEFPEVWLGRSRVGAVERVFTWRRPSTKSLSMNCMRPTFFIQSLESLNLRAISKHFRFHGKRILNA